MQVDLFDYDLPPGSIAQTPIEPRDASRLMVLERAGEAIRHHWFRDLPSLLAPGDLLIVNDSRVMPARLIGRRDPCGARIELLLLRRLDGDRWEALVKPGRRAPIGARLLFGRGELAAGILEKTDFGGRIVEFEYDPADGWENLLHRCGQTPLPPYIHVPLQDPGRYQTIYAAREGSAAAPTAGLHFTPDLLARLREAGIEMAALTLHVGLGTFRPVTVDKVEEHVMHAEFYTLPAETADAVARAKAAGRRVVAVGTTSVRTLEAAARNGSLQPGSAWTDIFIYPGYEFRVADALLTNFHLPRSTLLMLVSAFAGREFVLRAYRTAVAEGYRFFSFGDAMLIL